MMVIFMHPPPFSPSRANHDAILLRSYIQMSKITAVCNNDQQCSANTYSHCRQYSNLSVFLPRFFIPLRPMRLGFFSCWDFSSGVDFGPFFSYCEFLYLFDVDLGASRGPTSGIVVALWLPSVIASSQISLPPQASRALQLPLVS